MSKDNRIKRDSVEESEKCRKGKIHEMNRQEIARVDELHNIERRLLHIFFKLIFFAPPEFEFLPNMITQKIVYSS